MVANLRFLRALVATNLKSSLALRGAFWLQAVFMLGNNLIFFTTWWIFFAHFESLGGWRLADMTALYGMVAFSFGFSVVFLGGTRDLARCIADGELDIYLTQPKSPLFHLLASRTFPSGWGDMLTGVLFLALSGLVRPASLPVAIAGAAAGTVVFTASGVLVHSLAFFAGPMNTLARQVQEFVLAFSLYPPSIFPGALRLVLYTALPAALMGHLPVEVLHHFTWGRMLGLLGGAAAFAVAAILLFGVGLRRYESGSRFGLRGA